MNGSNKLATRSEFNSQIKGSHFSSDTSKIVTASEISNLKWTSGSHKYIVQFNNAGNYSNTSRCPIHSDIKRIRCTS
jgi:hypothetical protein